MPELPEAETIVRDLKRRVTGHRITSVQVAKPDVLTHATPEQFRRKLKDHTIKSVGRRAKNIVIRLDRDLVLVINLGMTGRVVSSDAVRAGELRHVAVRLKLDDGREVLYDDARRFGRLELFTDAGWTERESQFGVEPLSNDFTPAHLYEGLKTSRVPVRNWLLDQSRIAGVGNIYANEALFRAGIRPTRRANLVTRAEATRLRDAIRDVLAEAIAKRGTTLSDYRDASGEEGGFQPLLQVYGREGEPCPRCGSTIRRVVITNRSAFYCPKDQK